MIRKIGLIAGQNFSGWHRNARIWLTFALGLVLCLMLSDQMLTRAQTYDASIQIFEPFIWTFGDGESVLLSTLLLLVLFADMPFIDQAAPYRLVRTTRGIWLAGQMVYVALAVMVYDLFLLTAESLIAMPWAYTGNVWSETSAAFAYCGEGNCAVPVSLKTMEMRGAGVPEDHGNVHALCVRMDGVPADAPVFPFYRFPDAVPQSDGRERGGRHRGAARQSVRLSAEPGTAPEDFRYPGYAGLPGKRAVRVAVTASARHISDA